MPLVADDVERAGLTFSVFWHQLQLFRKITRLLQTRGIEQYHACYGTRKEGVERKFDVGTTKSKNTVKMKGAMRLVDKQEDSLLRSINNRCHKALHILRCGTAFILDSCDNRNTPCQVSSSCLYRRYMFHSVSRNSSESGPSFMVGTCECQNTLDSALPSFVSPNINVPSVPLSYLCIEEPVVQPHVSYSS